jgi:glycosyltransferase involved in cell wall biosynthesis
MRVCYFGTYRANYARNRIMIEGLRRNGVEVIECHAELWTGIQDRVETASGGWIRPAFWARVMRAYAHLLAHYRRMAPYDIMMVGYPGQLDIFLARLLCWLNRKPLVWDVFMSVYLIAKERRLDKRSGITVSLLRSLEWLAIRLPDQLVIDTQDYAAWLGATHHVDPRRFRLVPTGADSRLFHPLSGAQRAAESLKVVYYGSYIPNHSVCTIVEAAGLLAWDPTIHFELIGDGPDKDRAMALAASRSLNNISFLDWMDAPALAMHIADADICLGAFGTTPQSLMTVHNKIYESLAMAKPTLTGDSPAVRAVLTHGEHVFLCSRENPAALAEAIQILQHDPTLRERLSANGRRIFLEQFDLEPLGRCCLMHLQALSGSVTTA